MASSNHNRNNLLPSTSIPTAPISAPVAGAVEKEEDSDALLASLEAEESSDTGFPSHLREARAQKLAEELRHARQYAHPDSESTVIQQLVGGDDSVLKFTTQNQRCLVHFSHPEFDRCRVMDEHLRKLAARHCGEEVRFGSVDVRSAPFVVEKLGIRMLPCVVGFRDGVGVGRIVGFEGLGVFAGEEEGTIGVTKGIEGLVVGWGVFGGRTKGWGVGSEGGGDGSSEEDEDREEIEGHQRTRKHDRLFGHGRRGIQGRKKVVGDDDDDDWD